MGGFIMAGRMQAAIFVIVSTLVSLMLPPMLVFSNAAIALITLRKGWQQGLIYALIATASLMIVSGILKQDIGRGFVHFFNRPWLFAGPTSYNAGVSEYRGNLDDIRFFNRSLDEEEIQMLYK